MGLFLCLCVLMAILPLLVIPSKRSYSKIISLLQNSEDNDKTFACTYSVKSHHDLARLSLSGVAIMFDASQSSLSLHFLTCCISSPFILVLSMT